jgi:transcriptional repressor NrdR
MRCPRCREEDTRVLDTRPGPESPSVKRRRQCPGCGLRFSTLETPMREEVMVEKRSGNVEEFDRQKIVASLQCALKKGNRRREEVEALVDEIVRTLMLSRPGRLTSAQIGNEVMRCLLRVDQLAYARYLSVHRTFANLSDFQRRIGTLDPHGNAL